ncbi:MAG: extracellular solute-binding protein [Rhodobacteraceae bacterium]|nr:extracellular solute-binding protein [Paracoccaceae bacterium]
MNAELTIRRAATVLLSAVALFFGALSGLAAATERCDDPRVAMAIEEGELIVVASVFETPETQNAHRNGFIEYWCLPDDFKVSYDIRNTSGTIARIEAEVSQGVPISGDVTTMPAITWLADAVERGLIMAYESPEYAHMKLPERIGLNNRPYWTSDMYMMFPMWNSDELPDLEINSWDDLLKPELKGKMSMMDGSSLQSVALVFHYLKQRLPEDYWEKLAAQDILISSTSMHGVEMMMSGERPLSIFGVSADANVLSDQGATHIRTAIPKEGVMLQEQATAAFADAPHPNAAQLWIDFLRSHPGQVIFEKFEGRIPGREGVPSSFALTPNADDIGDAAFAPDYQEIAVNADLVRNAQEDFAATFINR